MRACKKKPAISTLRQQLQFAIALTAIVPLLALSYLVLHYVAPGILAEGGVVALIIAVLILMLTGTRMIFRLIAKTGGSGAAAQSGEERPRLEALQSVEVNEGRSIRHTVAEATELIDRRLMEQVNRRLAEITRNARDGIILTDAGGRTTYVNPAFEEMTGYSEEELLGGDPADLIVAEDTKAVGDEIRSAVMENGEWTGELLCRRKNGEVYPVESRVFTIRNADGELVEIAAIQQDISERRLADSALRESEQRYRSLFMDSPLSLWEEDFSEVKKRIDKLKGSGVRDFRRYFEKHPEEVGRCASMVKVVDVNSAMLGMYEAESKEELQDDLRRLFSGATYGTFREELIAIAEGKTSFQCDCVARTLKGGTKYTSLSWSVSPGREDDLSKVLVSIVDITERKMAEEKLSRYALIYRSIDEALVISTNDGVIIDVNPAAEKMCGWSRDELVGRKAGMVNPPELAGRITEEITRDLEKEGVWRGEVPLLTKSGERRTLSTVVSYILDSSDNRIGTIGINRDITDITRTQEKLRASAHRWNATFDAISDAISLIDTESRFLLCNKAMVELVARPAGEIVGKICYEVVHGTSEPPDWCLFQRMLKSRKKETADMMVKDRWFNVTVDPLQENGRLLGGVHILADITERKRAEKALRESEGRFRMLFEKAPLAYQALNGDGYIIDVNPAWLSLLGYKRAEVIGRWFGDFLGPESADWYREQFFHFKSTGEINGIELEMLGKGGRSLTVLFSGRVAHDKTGRFMQAHCTFNDIGERKRTEERLRHSQKLEAVGHLAGGFAHDFNNILAGIVGYASLLENALGEESPLCADAKAIVNLSHRGAGLTKALLAFARKGKYYPRILKVNEVIGAVVEIIAKTVGKGLEIRLELSPDIPGVFADEEQLRQVVMNLCINACEAIREGGTMTVRSACTVPDEGFFEIHDELKRGPYVLFSVSDTGAGFDEDTRSHIFEPFFSTKAQKSGTGLGLPTVLGIVEGHDGCVGVGSAPGRGSTFTIYLPAVEAKGEAGEAGAQGGLGGGEGILVVDDEQDIRRGTRRWLQEFGYTVFEAAGGKEALDLLGKEKGAVDLIILDMVMKGMSGTKTFEELKKIAPDIPVIICTGYSTDISRQMLLRGASQIIQKPFDPDKLIQKIRAILDKR